MIKKIVDLDLAGKRVLLRVDLNVPVFEGEILDYTRIDKIVPTIEYLINAGAKIILASHFGRPKGKVEEKYSLQFLRAVLEEKFKKPIIFCPDILNVEALKVSSELKEGEILLLENLRFYSGEEANSIEFAKILASFAEFYINDAFSCSHRSHASIAKITELLPCAAGLLLDEEISNLTGYLKNALNPVIAIIGGSKVSSKLSLLKTLVNKVDYLAIGGAMANTFLYAKGYNIGKSFYEPDLIDVVKDILANNSDCKIILPSDVIVANEISNSAKAIKKELSELLNDDIILDIGNNSVLQIINLINLCKTVVCNGPLGMCEYEQFSFATTNIAKEIAKLTLEKKIVSVAGGGDIISVLNKNNLAKNFSYISTGGGAFLEWLEGRELPGIALLSKNLY